jgi:BolA protein
MDINQLSKIVKKKILAHKTIESVEIEDRSYLHKNHKSKEAGKFHLKITIRSTVLKNKSRIDSNKFIFKIIDKELKENIHSIQLFFL